MVEGHVDLSCLVVGYFEFGIGDQCCPLGRGGRGDVGRIALGFYSLVPLSEFVDFGGGGVAEEEDAGGFRMR